MKKHAYILFITLCLLSAITLSAQESPEEEIKVGQTAIERLSKAITFPTISYYDSAKFDYPVFASFRKFLKDAFPALHNKLDLTIINGHSLLYKWEGSNTMLKPIMLYAHYDVVPVDDNTGEDWKHPPFKGVVADGAVWGRGTLDDKGRAMAILETVEYLIDSNFEPTRTIYFAFGHDEEVNGWQGANKIAEYFHEKKIQMAAIFDEGGSVMENIIEEIDRQLAFISIAEKGHLNLKLRVEEAGGHSSVPPHSTSIGILSKAVYELEENQMFPRITAPVRQLLEITAPEMGIKEKLAIKFPKLLNRVILNQLAKERATDALIRTKYSVNMINGGVKANVLPQVAEAVVNVRVLQGDSIETVINHFTEVVDDLRVEITVLDNYVPPSGVTPTNTIAFNTFGNLINQIYPDALIVPVLMPGSTDSKHFRNLSQNILRFSPMLLNGHEALSIHGTNEKIDIEIWEKMIRFYFLLITDMSGSPESLTDVE